jgi:DNA-binding transcriptional LysR family regulator
MDRLEAMSILVRAAESGSLSAASRELGIPLPTVSRNVAELEAHLKTILFVRSRKGLQLTEAGRSYVATAKGILENITQAERAAAGEYMAPTGDLVIAAPVVFGRQHLLPVVSEFLNAFPDVNLRLIQSDRNMHLVDEHIDVALRIGELADSALKAVTLGSVRPVICASPDYIARKGRPNSLEELTRHSCIMAEAFGMPQAWRLKTEKGDIAIPVRSRLIVNTMEAAIDAAIAGVGLTLALSYQVAEQVRRGALQIVLEKFKQPVWPVHFLYNNQDRLPLKLRAFMDFTAPRLRQRLSDIKL